MIWTRFAKLILVLGLLLLASAIVTGHPAMLVVGTLTSVWIILESLLFSTTHYFLRRGRMTIRRQFPELSSDGVAWAGVKVRYEAKWTLPALPIFGSMNIREFLPGGLVSHGTEWFGLFYPLKTCRWKGQIETKQSGLYTLPGLSLEVFSPTGFFHSFIFIEAPLKLNVYPNVFGVNVARSSKKSLNRLLQLGLHRYKNKGGHGELLEIREYVPGDQIKQIAWKISARRDELFVKELEREVPIRTWMFVDGGYSSRFGSSGQRPIDQMIHIVGQVARGTLDSKDPVGVCLFQGDRGSWVVPGTGRQHLFRILRQLAEFSSQRPSHAFGQLKELSKNVEAYLYRRYPELMSPANNPEPSLRLPPLNRGEMRRRKVERHMAAVVTLLLNDGRLEHAASAISIADNEKLFSKLLTDFALKANLHVTIEAHLTGPQLIEESRERLDHCAKLLSLAVTRAKDNEVYVLFIDYIGGSTEKLMRAVRGARARRHKVLVI
ncbi:MAG: DUF58 domain-containing protein, partial [Planctomycetota bacterium]|nr:DUF58 domain-containing protein [Planctomycetota bacterium]